MRPGVPFVQMCLAAVLAVAPACGSPDEGDSNAEQAQAAQEASAAAPSTTTTTAPVEVPQAEPVYYRPTFVPHGFEEAEMEDEGYLLNWLCAEPEPGGCARVIGSRLVGYQTDDWLLYVGTRLGEGPGTAMPPWPLPGEETVETTVGDHPAELADGSIEVYYYGDEPLVFDYQALRWEHRPGVHVAVIAARIPTDRDSGSHRPDLRRIAASLEPLADLAEMPSVVATGSVQAQDPSIDGEAAWFLWWARPAANGDLCYGVSTEESPGTRCDTPDLDLDLFAGHAPGPVDRPLTATVTEDSDFPARFAVGAVDGTIATVEVRVEDGSPVEADLHDAPGRDDLRLFAVPLPDGTETESVEVTALDEQGGTLATSEH